MSRQDQINLLKRLLHYVETRTTAMAESPWRNEVSAYTDAERLADEQRVLFRKYPLVMGFASDWFSTICCWRRDPPSSTSQQYNNRREYQIHQSAEASWAYPTI